MINTSDILWDDATFMPHDEPSRSDLLLQKVHAGRQAAFVAFSLRLLATNRELCGETGFLDQFNRFKNAEPDERQQVLENPLFVVWLKKTLRSQPDVELLRTQLAELKRVLKIAAEEDESLKIIVEGKAVRVKRYELDRLIAETASPEYSLPDERRRAEFERNVVYPETFAREMLAVALERIKRSWFEAYRDFPKFVRVVVDMIDGEYTSYSAAEHTGVIFVSTDNSPLVALEEFLIHELGHQILYHVMELDPIVTDAVKETYRLPWSGNERDFYGYFHAFYIYILIARYLERVEHRSKREQRRIAKRIGHIIGGLRQAVSAFEKTDGFTIYGRQLFENLKREVGQLENGNAKSAAATGLVQNDCVE